jgi:hypothetical protein
MPVLVKKSPIQKLIDLLEEREAAIRGLVAGIESVATDLPPEIEVKVLESLRVSVLEALRDHADDPSLDLAQVFPSQTNYDKVVQFLRSKGNAAQTIEEIMKATGLGKGSLSLVIYGKRKSEFISEKTGQGKKLAWKIRNTVQPK